MSDFSIASSRGSYSVRVGLGVATEVTSATLVLIDPVVRSQAPVSLTSVIEIEGTEESKTLAGCERVIIAMHAAGLARGEVVAAIGGGVVQDVATLATSLYMRGVQWTYVPTTLMSMADSCIGGKSSINAGGIKNLVGNFHPPRGVLVDPRFIKSLPREAIVSGLAEAVKICFSRGQESFATYLNSAASHTPGADDATAHLLDHVLRSKKWFIEIDEFDKSERQLLNFGHSFGHAWEAACAFTIPHGVAVAAGVLAACRHPAAARTHDVAALESYCIALLRTIAPSVRAAFERTDWDLFKRALSADKKNSRDTLRLVLPAAEGSVAIVSLSLTDQELGIARDALFAVLEESVR